MPKPYSEVIGKVVGNDGKTYQPKIEQNGKDIRFIFKTDLNDSEEDGYSYNVSLPLPQIQADYEDNILTFKYKYNNIDIDDTTLASIDMSKYKGDPGTITIDTINFDNVVIKDGTYDSGNFRTDKITSINNKILEENVLYVLESYNNPSLSGDTYFIQIHAEDIEWIRVNDFINIDNYTLLSDFNRFKNEVNNKMNCIAMQQQEIQKILRDGIDTDIEVQPVEISNEPINLSNIQVIWYDNYGESQVKEGPTDVYNFIKTITQQIYSPETNND